MTPVRHLPLTTVLLFVASLSPVPVRAGGTDDDGGVWFMALAQGSFESVGPKFENFLWWLDNHLRYTDDSNGFEQSIVRPALGYKILPNTSAWLGYAWILTDPPAGSFHEHRIWQQAIWSTQLDPVTLQSRTRLEQRFIKDRSKTGWRLRQFVKLVYPFPFEPRLRLAAYDEVFFDLNDTDWGADAGFAQNRAFAGLAWKFDPEWHTTVEVGYLNQFLRDRSDDDSVNHLLSVNVFLDF